MASANCATLCRFAGVMLTYVCTSAYHEFWCASEDVCHKLHELLLADNLLTVHVEALEEVPVLLLAAKACLDLVKEAQLLSELTTHRRRTTVHVISTCVSECTKDTDQHKQRPTAHL